MTYSENACFFFDLNRNKLVYHFAGLKGGVAFPIALNRYKSLKRKSSDEQQEDNSLRFYRATKFETAEGTRGWNASESGETVMNTHQKIKKDGVEYYVDCGKDYPL